MEKIAHPRGWMNEKQKKSPVQGVGKAPNGIFCFQGLGNAVFEIFCSSQVWEIRFSTFSRFPNFGKVFSADFWFSLVREIRFPLFSCFPP